MNATLSAGALAGLRERFRTFAGRAGQVSFAPGRVNLIGEHTDYTGGYVLPASLAIGTWTLAAPRADQTVRVLSESQSEVVSFRLDIQPEQARAHWSDYVAGVVWALQRSGRTIRGADVLISSNVPMGSGLSSSAALEVSMAYALLGAAGLELAPLEIAHLCRVAENQFVGARCGIMDQFIATHGESGRAVLLDCDSLAWRTVPLPPTHGWIVANTMVRHSLAHGEYNIRRAECDEIAMLGRRRFPQLHRLADLIPGEAEELERDLQPVLRSRLRHVVGENRRVHEAVGALEGNRPADLGQLLTASHASLRSNFQVSCAELDLMVDLALPLPGVLGARMIGGGFGGCTLTLVEAEHAEAAVSQLRSTYARHTKTQPAISLCEFGGAGGYLP